MDNMKHSPVGAQENKQMVSTSADSNTVMQPSPVGAQDVKQEVSTPAFTTSIITPDPCDVERDLAELRSEIDDIDSELLQLLARRMEVSAQIGAYKKSHNVTVVQMDRWKKILAEHIETGNDLGLSPELVSQVFEAIHQASIERQSDIMESES